MEQGGENVACSQGCFTFPQAIGGSGQATATAHLVYLLQVGNNEKELG